MRPTTRRRVLKTAAVLLALSSMPYLLLPWYSRWGTAPEERRAALPGDAFIPQSRTGYTMATNIRAAPAEVWPWLVQMGQGRAGFYTYEVIESLLGAGIRNVDSIVPTLQNLAVGDTVRLTPDPYHGLPGQFLVVAEIQPQRALVFRQILPNGSPGTWSFVLIQHNDMTRLLFRRRGTRPSLFDRIMAPGYVLMDRGMLRGIRSRAEGPAS